MNKEQNILKAKTPWAVLGLTGAESVKEIKHAYRKLALVYHPDRPTGNSEVFLAIQRAHLELIGNIGQYQTDEDEEADEEEEKPQPEKPAAKKQKTSIFDDDGMQVSDSDEEEAEEEDSRPKPERKANERQRSERP